VRNLLPACATGRCSRGYAGNPPEDQRPTEPAADFLVQGPEGHGIPGLVNLYGIESPGITSSLRSPTRSCAFSPEEAVYKSAAGRQSRRASMPITRSPRC